MSLLAYEAGPGAPVGTFNDVGIGACPPTDPSSTAWHLHSFSTRMWTRAGESARRFTCVRSAQATVFILRSQLHSRLPRMLAC
eukprot:3455441-Rhodomonas_salina.8